ncbi:tail length tape measure protein [Burkholderia phage BcepNazgul]|uniref:Tape measure protein n=1 Tax=Burkholderia phage BcepNazgul TaxID=242861 RepID=Q6UYJ1_9CAUD|nr:tail length tape measure protein [Burkholderia phage BcepNazgul]AAQ63350.1 tape measure protein [Burkholderia phage BcepNazgul]
MATNNQKEVDLIIRAKDMSAQAMKDAKKAIDEVTSSLADQVKQAKAATAGTDSLGKAAASLSDQQKNLSKAADAVQKAMSGAADALDQAKTRAGAASQAFNTANENLDRHKRSVEGAAIAYQMFARDALNAGPPTRSTARELDKLAAAAAGGGRDFERLTQRVAKAGQDVQAANARTASLTKSMAELSGLEAQVAEQAEQVAKAMNQQAQATQAAAAAADRLNARQDRARAAGAAIVAAGREQAAREAAAQAAVNDANAKAFDARLARIRAAAQAEAAAASKDLTAQSQQANGIRATTAAMQGHNAEAAKTVSLLDRITTGNRESLSWYQRVRGELIALATAYVGVQGAINLAAGALDAMRKFNSNESVLAVAAGTNDPKVVAQEYQYVQAQAERLGIRIDDLAASYGKFAVSAKAAGATTNQTRFIFEKVAETARVLHMSADDMQGTFLAIEQMMSKGQVQAEELRGQLGDRLPAAFALFAKGMNISLPELNKRLKEGSVSVKELLGFAQQLGDEYGKQLPMAVNNMQAAEARMYNAFYEFRKAIADMGFADAWTKFAVDMTKLLRSDDGKQFARNFSDAFTVVLNILEAVIKNINAVGDVIGLVLGVKVMASIGAFTIQLTQAAFAMAAVGASGAAAAPGVDAAGASMATASVAADRLNAALAAINKIFLVLTAAFTGWQIGKILGEKFETARLVGTAAAESIYEAWINVKYGILVLAAQMSDSVVDFFDKALKKIQTLKNGFLGGLRSTAEFLGLDNVAEQLGRASRTALRPGWSRPKHSRSATSLRFARSAIKHWPTTRRRSTCCIRMTSVDRARALQRRRPDRHR